MSASSIANVNWKQSEKLKKLIKGGETNTVELKAAALE